MMLSLMFGFMRCPACGRRKLTPWTARAHWRKAHLVRQEAA